MKRLFVSGMARSGTSWLLKLFGCHPDVLCLYEPFNLAERRRGLPADLRFWDLLPRLRKMVAEGNPESAVREFARPLARFDQVRDHRLDREPLFPQPAEPRLLALKEDLSDLLAVAGEFGQVLFIVRDPRAVLNSLWNHTEFGKNYGARSTIERWCRNAEEALTLREKDPENYQIVRYEDLVREPTTLAELYAWVRVLPQSPEVERFYRKSMSRHEADPYSVFKDPRAVEALWKNQLSAPIQELVLKVAASSRAAELYPEVFE